MIATAVEPEKTHVARELAHKAPLIACRFDPKGRYAYAGSEDRSVQRWEIETGKQAGLTGHDGWVFAMGFSPDSQSVLTGGCDGALKWWTTDAEAPELVRSVEAHRGWIRSIAVSPDGTLAATCGNDRRVRLWSMADGSHIVDLPGHDRPVYRVAFVPGGHSLLSADLKGVLIEWDYRPGKEARRLDATKLYQYNGGQQVDYGGVRDVSFSPDGRLLACSGLIEASNPLGAVSNPAVLLLDWEGGKETILQRPKEDLKGVAWGVRFHPAGFLVAVSGGTGGGRLLFWKPDQVNEFFQFALPNTGRDLDLHPDAARLAVAHHDGKLRIYAMYAKPA
jgi:WD40 repeat protein